MYYPKHKIIFIAINKTGSTSILTALNQSLYDKNVDEIWQLNDNPGVGRIHEYLKHAQAYFYYHHLGKEKYNECFSFSQVRNPWDKVVSDFFFRCRSPKEIDKWKNTRKWFIKHGLFEPTENPGKELFKLFVKALYRNDLTPHGHWKATSRKFDMPDIFKKNSNQIDGLSDLEGNLMVDRVIKLEETAKEWKSIQAIIKEKTGLELGDLPHVNKSNRDDYKNYYDEETYQMVYHLFNQDIKHFGYKF